MSNPAIIYEKITGIKTIHDYQYTQDSRIFLLFSIVGIKAKAKRARNP